MEINSIIHGFKINNISHLEEIDADLYEMSHVKTSARAIWLKRADENKTFSIAFKTTPVDDTGVFHILEHSVLNGSEKYPVETLKAWWDLRKERQDKIDASISAHAESEYLYDKPYVDNTKVRVTGPFTVESLDPHRMLNVDENGNPLTPHWVYRESHEGGVGPIPYQGKKLGTLTVNVNAGYHNGNATLGEPLQLPVLDMDTLNHDYCYGKIQLPYYNELFGDSSSDNHEIRYGHNYTDSIVTGWKITAVVGDEEYYNFSESLDGGYDYANRYCYDKDIFEVSGRVFAQGCD